MLIYFKKLSSEDQSNSIKYIGKVQNVNLDQTQTIWIPLIYFYLDNFLNKTSLTKVYKIYCAKLVVLTRPWLKDENNFMLFIYAENV